MHCTTATCLRAPIQLRQQRKAHGSCCQASLPQQRCPASTGTTLTSSSLHSRAPRRNWRARATGTEASTNSDGWSVESDGESRAADPGVADTASSPAAEASGEEEDSLTVTRLDSDSEETSSSESDSSRRTLSVTFTCDKCDARTERLVNPHAYYKGLVFVQCGGCEVWHQLKDNQGLIVEYDLRD